MAEKRFLQNAVLIAAVLGTLAISPFTTQDPFNLIKMCVISFVASISVSVVIFNWRAVQKTIPKHLIFICSGFIFWMLISTIYSSRSLAEQLFGVFGRNTGLLTYTSLTVILLVSVFVSSEDLLDKFIGTILAVAVPIQVYGHLQFLGIEFFPYNSVYDSKVFSTFGNTNFQSAFLGMTITVSIIRCFKHDLSLRFRIFLGVACLSSILGIMETESIQGFFACLISILMVASFLLINSKRFRFIGFAIPTLITVTVVNLFLDVVKVPFLSALSQEASVISRGYYWEAGIQMIRNKPLTGVGMDGYGDWFLRSRSQSAYDYNWGLLTNSSHNVILDIGSGGGIFLALLYVSLMVLAISRVYFVFRSGKTPTNSYTCLVAFWFAYQIQSLISINQIGLGIWGWISTGLILGYPELVDVNADGDRKRTKENPNKAQLKPKTILGVFSGSILGLCVSLPAYLGSSSFFSALSSNDPNLIFRAAGINPHNEQHYSQVSQIMFSSGLNEEALYVLRQGLVEFPDSIQMWDLLERIPTSTEDEKVKAKNEIKRLDPLRFNEKGRG